MKKNCLFHTFQHINFFRHFSCWVQLYAAKTDATKSKWCVYRSSIMTSHAKLVCVWHCCKICFYNLWPGNFIWREKNFFPFSCTLLREQSIPARMRLWPLWHFNDIKNYNINKIFVICSIPFRCMTNCYRWLCERMPVIPKVTKSIGI